MRSASVVRRRGACILGVIAFASLSISPLAAAPGKGALFGTDGANLILIDPVTGAGTVVGPLSGGGASSYPSLAVDPATGVMYAGGGAGTPDLYTVNPSSGALTLVGSTGLGVASIEGLDFTGDGVLYAAVSVAGSPDSGADHLVKINKATGAATVVGPFGTCTGVTVPSSGGGSCSIEGMEGIAFDASGALWGSTNVSGAADVRGLYRIAFVTGAAAHVSRLVDKSDLPPSGGVVSLQFGCDGKLWGGSASALGAASDGGRLLRTDALTGLFGFQDSGSTTGGISLEALAYKDPCVTGPTITLPVRFSPQDSLGALSPTGTVVFNTDPVTGGSPFGSGRTITVDSGGATGGVLVRVFDFDSINLPSNAVIRAEGSSPLILTSGGDTLINGALELSGSPGITPADGPGGGGGGGGALALFADGKINIGLMGQILVEGGDGGFGVLGSENAADSVATGAVSNGSEKGFRIVRGKDITDNIGRGGDGGSPPDSTGGGGGGGGGGGRNHGFGTRGAINADDGKVGGDPDGGNGGKGGNAGAGDGGERGASGTPGKPGKPATDNKAGGGGGGGGGAAHKDSPDGPKGGDGGPGGTLSGGGGGGGGGDAFEGNHKAGDGGCGGPGGSGGDAKGDDGNHGKGSNPTDCPKRSMSKINLKIGSPPPGLPGGGGAGGGGAVVLGSGIGIIENLGTISLRGGESDSDLVGSEGGTGVLFVYGTLSSSGLVNATIHLSSGQAIEQWSISGAGDGGDGAAPGSILNVPPICRLAGSSSGPPASITVHTEDDESGLGAINILEATNADVDIPPFTPGTNDPVIVKATKIDQSQRSVVQLRVFDVAGNSVTCDPVITLVIRENGKPVTQAFNDIPQAESKVQILNGSPGLKSLLVTVNGVRYRVDGLKDGEQRTIDVAASMRPGNQNSVTLTAHGKPGGSAMVIIHD